MGVGGGAMTAQQLTAKGKRGASIATVSALGAGLVFTAAPNVVPLPCEVVANGVKDACELAHYLPHVAIPRATCAPPSARVGFSR